MPQIEQWREMWKALGSVCADAALFRELIGCYAEKHRSYHTLQHLDECLDRLAEVRPLAVHPEEIELALWFHDAIYDVKRKDNEEKSANWARSSALRSGLSRSVAERLYRLVLATRHDAVPEGTDAEILVDIDLSILGASAERFEEYEHQVRREYAWVPAFLFRRQRRKILEGFMERPRIFNAGYFYDRLEEQARSNLRRSLGKLGG